ncbi:MAG: hypothetical protein K6F57_03430 [Candidatus Saccharibacteria bacterium]|nr:hypothetical protein [Candidatus Saccharibacteria bacterium]
MPPQKSGMLVALLSVGLSVDERTRRRRGECIRKSRLEDGGQDEIA